MTLKQQLVIIGCSTGGLPVIQEIFTGIPDLNASILILQHINLNFETVLKDCISRLTHMRVVIAISGGIIENGTVIIAPPGRHLLLRNNMQFEFSDHEKVNYVRPAIDCLLKSCVRSVSVPITGIILTGMGKDGAEGVRYLKSIGGTIIVQDPDTAPIGSMPRSAIETGVADHILTPAEIRGYLIRKFGV